MRRKLLILLLSVCVIVSQVAPVCAADSVAVPADDYSAADYAENEILVSFDDKVSDRTVEKVVKKEDCECSQIEDDCGDMKIAQVEIPDDLTVEEAIGEFEKNPKVVSAQPNLKYELYEEVSEPAITDTESKYYQYQISQTKADKAWKLLEGNKNKAHVVVIDTGVDVQHEDLQEVLSNDVKTNGYTSFAYGEESKTKFDSGNHGTHVVGIIGATYGNSLGGCGVASGPSNDLVELDVIGASPDGYNLYTLDIMKALKKAMDMGADVISMSYGVSARDRLTEAVVEEAYEKDIVLVAASGNESTDEFTSPMSFNGVISVNAVNSKGKSTWFTNYGRYTDISAPGDDILSTVPGDRYSKMSGTSMATPVVSAICAMVLDANPDLTADQVKNIICSSTGKNFSNKRAFGIIDAEKSVQAAIDADDVEVEGIVLKDTKGIVTVEEGDYTYLDAVLRPANILYKNSLIKWKAADDTIVKVDSDGKLTGLKEGRTTVWAEVETAGEPIKTTGIFVEVTKEIEDVERLAIKNKDKMSKLEVGNVLTLNVDTNAEGAEVYWKSSNGDVAFVESLGSSATCIFLTEGTVTLKAMTKDVVENESLKEQGKNYDEVEISVGKSSVTGRFVSKTDRLLVGEKYTFTLEPLAKDGTVSSGGTDISYESEDPSVAEVDSATGEVTAKKAGITYITATINYLPQEINFLGITFELPVSLYGKTTKLVVGKDKYEAADYGLKVSSVTDSSTTIKWNSLKAVSGYKVYKKVDGKYTEVKKLSGDKTSYTDKNVTAGTSYSYKVKAYYNNADTKLSMNFDSSAAVKAVTKPGKVTGLKATSVKSKASLAWTKAKGASGYIIYRATRSNGKYVSVGTATGTKYTDKKVKSGKKYWYKVKAYTKADGKKVYGNISAAAKVSVK